jgi:uncharacterized protein
VVYIRGVTTLIFEDFEWDEEKARSNIKKHGVSFIDAVRAVLDERSIVDSDSDFEIEARWTHIGMSRAGVLFVVTTERWQRTRIISAREATRHEQERYARGEP